MSMLIVAPVPRALHTINISVNTQTESKKNSIKYQILFPQCLCESTENINRTLQFK